MSRIEASGLSVDLGGRHVLREVSIAVGESEIVGLIGPNGAGKTTLLRALAGLQPVAGGEIRFDGAPLATMPRRALARQLSYLPQGGRPHWAVPVAELVMLGRLPHHGAWSGPGEADRDAVLRVLEATDTAYLAERPATELSGGEHARVQLARALAGEPQVLLADEPVAGLDPYHRLEVMEHLRDLAASGTAVVVVVHDLTLAARFCSRVILLHDGRVACDGTAGEALSADRLAEVYKVRAVTGERDGEPYVVPWERIGER